MADLSSDAETSERDDNTVELFGGAPEETAASSSVLGVRAAYTVIARKYRPRTFEDLIGQEAMVRTLRNAFASRRIAHAFMLTGVRGVGKTTTARLLARALNYESDTVKEPSADLALEGYHCASIIAGRNLNVIEVDAASQSKVDEMRDLLAGVNTVPVGARFRVYIIDEVHMLSTSAFNALLKTLEEPPPHVKFIFATTEIRKVPVTILSRCQRFDLRRVEPDVIAANLEAIAAKEGARVDEDALKLIARASEGSVRDAQSLLDQAILQAGEGEVVSGAAVRDMLGLADRSQTIGLLETLLKGDIAAALQQFRTLYAYGADPTVVLSDLLEHLHAASLCRVLGSQVLQAPSDQAERLSALGANASAGVLSRLWSLALKAHEETRRAPDPVAAAEMALIRLAYAAELPGPEEALRRLELGRSGGAPQTAAAEPRAPSSPEARPPSGPTGRLRAAGQGGGASEALANVRSAPAADAESLLQSFTDVVKLIESKRDVVLKLDVDRFVRLVDFRPGQITFATADGAPKDLTQRLAGRLKEWTGRPWTMVIEGGAQGSETQYERERREASALRAEVERHPAILALRDAFPGAEIVGVRRLLAAEPQDPSDDKEEDDG